jgi:hypothetical protein
MSCVGHFSQKIYTQTEKSATRVSSVGTVLFSLFFLSVWLTCWLLDMCSRILQHRSRKKRGWWPLVGWWEETK